MKGEFDDPAAGARIDWRTHRTLAGFGAFGAIGFLGGAVRPRRRLRQRAGAQPADGARRSRSRSARAALIISIINSSAAWVYIHRGALLPLLAVPAILGVMLGSRIGARLLARDAGARRAPAW